MSQKNLLVRKAALSVKTDAHTAVLLDQHPLWLNALERILASAGVTPVGTATSTSQALLLVEEHQPDLFVLDADMNGDVPDGMTCLRNAALSNGAVAYVLKRAEPEDLASAIRQVFSRSLYLAGSTGGGAARWTPPPADANAAGLTRREREILQLVAEGNTNGQVARKLWVTEQTVKFHLANIFRKLDVTNRTQASRWAHAHGLLQPDAEAHAFPATAGVR
jgi:DNA-binding NarL/FixJ family response regulator